VVSHQLDGVDLDPLLQIRLIYDDDDMSGQVVDVL